MHQHNPEQYKSYGDMPKEYRKKLLTEFGIASDEDGFPIRGEQMGVAKPCLRCGLMVEKPVDAALFYDGKDYAGPICSECYSLQMTDSKAFFRDKTLFCSIVEKDA